MSGVVLTPPLGPPSQVEFVVCAPHLELLNLGAYSDEVIPDPILHPAPFESRIPGVFSEKVTPVSIPNTVVKLFSVDGTWLSSLGE